MQQHTGTVRLVFMVLAAVLGFSSAFGAPVTASAAYPSFTFNGAGYGHGIGLSQYGAKGWAEHGKTGSWIAKYYYPGTTIGDAPSSRGNLNVNLDSDANYRTTSTGYNAGFTQPSWRIRAGNVGGRMKISGVRLGETQSSTTTGGDGVYTFEIAKSGSTVTGIRVKNATGGTVATYSGQIVLEPLDGAPNLLQVLDASGPFDHTYVRYRGKMTLDWNALGNIKLRNVVGMQDYLKGVIPRESPSSWHVEALKAQAIVARSYAFTTGGDLYCTTWSQVYNGHSRGDRAAPTMHEADRTNTAVDLTNNQYVLYGGKVIKTFFHSSSGGHTADIEDVWLGTGEPSTTYPYRKGVEDPYCAGPYDPWTDAPTFSGLELAAKLASRVSGEPSGAGSSWWVKSVAIERMWPSGFARTVDITWTNGAAAGDDVVTRGVSGDTVRSALGLRSTKFFVNGVFSRIAYDTRYQTAIEVSKKAYPDSGVAQSVIIVNGADNRYPDALTAAALAGVAQGPVLLVNGTSVPAGVLDEIKRLGVSKAYVVGGTAAISNDVVLAVREAAGGNSERLAGSARYGYDRYGTAASVAMKIKSLGGDGTHAFIASGENWPDAAVAAALASGAKRPLLLVRKAALPAATANALTDLGTTRTAFYGGSAVISDATLKAVLARTGETQPEKRFGTNGGRYDTAVESAKWAVSSFGYSLSKVYVTSGETFVDAISGGVLSGMNKFPLLMTNKNYPSGPTASYLAANRATITEVVIIGGPGAVTMGTASTLASYAY